MTSITVELAELIEAAAETGREAARDVLARGSALSAFNDAVGQGSHAECHECSGVAGQWTVREKGHHCIEIAYDATRLMFVKVR